MEDADYLAWVRQQPCLVCHSQAVSHHAYKNFQNVREVPLSGGAGMQCSDYLTLPLCPAHHTGKDGIHTLGLGRFEGRYSISVEREIIVNLILYLKSKE